MERDNLYREIREKQADDLRQITAASDQSSAFKLAVAMNVTTNARMYCGMMFAAALVMYVKTGDGIGFALLFAAPVGVSVVADLAPAGRVRAFLSVMIYAYTIILSVCFLWLVR